jgi:hypothetical protein
MKMQAYGDIRNNGEQTIVIKGDELFSGKIFFNFSNFLF